MRWFKAFEAGGGVAISDRMHQANAEIGAANSVVQTDDGSLLDVEWDSGYDDWSRGDRVTLTTESGGGYMYSEGGETEVDVFPYNPADIGD